jgi:hypothetical protein
MPPVFFKLFGWRNASRQACPSCAHRLGRSDAVIPTTGRHMPRQHRYSSQYYRSYRLIAPVNLATRAGLAPSSRGFQAVPVRGRRSVASSPAFASVLPLRLCVSRGASGLSNCGRGIPSDLLELQLSAANWSVLRCRARGSGGAVGRGEHVRGTSVDQVNSLRSSRR